MSSPRSISIFLDERLADDLWTLTKRDGLTVEKVKEATAKIAGKAKFGFGNVWKWLAADVTAEISADVSDKHAEKIQVTAVYRAMLLAELIEDVVKVGGSGSKESASLQHGAYVEIEATTLELFPLPTSAGFMRLMALEVLDKSADDDSDFTDPQKLIAIIDGVMSDKRASTFNSRKETSGLLRKFSEDAGDELWNALCMSNDDHVLALSKVAGKEVVVYSVLEERYVKRNLAIFATDRPVRIFGRIARIGNNECLGVEPISITLD